MEGKAVMRIAVCCPSAQEAGWICRIIGEQAALAQKSVSTELFSSEEALWCAFEPGRFFGAVIGWGDIRGFLCARRVSEEDRSCRVIMLDDTDRYAIRSLRIHLTDYLVRPLEEARLRAAADRLLT